MEVGFKTDKGILRKKNEDSVFVIPKSNVYIIADGVGGNNSGQIASRRTVSGIARYVESHPLDDVKTFRTVKTYFNDCIQQINYDILRDSREVRENQGMATTLVLSFFVDEKMYVVNIGDSRAYILRDGELKQITEDHTYVNSLIKAGVITEEEAEIHEKRNMITRAVGADYNVEADFFSITVKPGDMILMCTDGLYGEVGEDKIKEVMMSDRGMGDICSELVEMANKNGGADNITMITLKITEEDING